MKKVIAFLTLTAALFSYDSIYNGFLNLYWGLNPDEVNERLLATNFIKAKVNAERVEIYENSYPDPEIAWKNRMLSRWTHFSFSTNLEALVKADPGIRYLTQVDINTFKRITLKGDMLQTPNSWVYRFYFYNNRLFAVSLRYENPDQVKAYHDRNPDKKSTHPGYRIPIFLFNENRESILHRYGGFGDAFFRSYDAFSGQYYGEYYRQANDTALSMYNMEEYGNFLNFTVSYVDNHELYRIYQRIQSRYYEGTADQQDILKF
ncbi:MAG: hypothetical protein HZC28_10430 [Spirochaetes bacterium]|nr:hypothetical protein [Spirochaetota bacterium]